MHTLFIRALGAALALTLGLVMGCQPTSTPVTAPDGVGEPNWVQDATVYEVFIPDFSEEGTFRGAIDRLDELEAMGVTTLWLMPIHPIGEERAKTDIGALGSPYAVRDFYGVNPEYGTEEDFQALVDSVHARDMHIIIDLVANHTAWDNPWLDEHPEWYSDGPIDGFTVPLLDGDTTDWTDVVELDYENEALRQEMIDVMQYWVREYDIDGYRADVAHQVPLDFWTAAIDSVETIKPVLMLAEAAEPEMHAAGFDMTYAWPFYGALKAVWEGNPVSELVTQVDTTLENLPLHAQRLRFTTNHDESMWDATPVELFGGLAGSEAAFVLATTMPGAPLVYNGQELGVQDTVSFFARTPYDWSRAADNPLTAFYTNYLRLRQASTALRRGTLSVLTPAAEDALLYTRSFDDETMLIAVNVRDQATRIPVPAAYRGDGWSDAFADTSVVADTLDLAPYGYRILRNGSQSQ
jgi:glycosidase